MKIWKLVWLIGLVCFAAEGWAGEFSEKIIFAGRLDSTAPWDVHMINPDGTGYLNLTADFDQNVVSCFFSPDGRHIAFTAKTDHWDIWVMNSDGSQKRQLTFLVEPYGPVLSDWYDNDTIMYTPGPRASFHEVRVVDIDGTNDHILIPSPFLGNPDVNSPRMSPSGTTIAVISQIGSWSPTLDVYLTDADGSNPRPFFLDADDNHIDRDGQWSRDGRVYFWNRDNVSGVGHQGNMFVKKALDSTAGINAFDEVVRPYQGVLATLDAVSPDDSRLLFHGPGDLKTFDLATGTDSTLFTACEIEDSDWERVPGTAEKIAFSARIDPESPFDIFMMNSDGTGLTNLTGDFYGDAKFPQISPDGRHIAFTNHTDHWDIWVMNSDGSQKRQLTFLVEPYGPVLSDWYDSDTIMYTPGPRESFHEVRVVDIDGTNDHILIPSPFLGNPDVNSPRMSPSGTTIAVISQIGSWSPTLDVYLTDADGSNPRPFFLDADDNHIDRDGQWSRDGRVYFWNRDNVSGVGHQGNMFVKKALDSTAGINAFDEVVRPYQGVLAVLDAVSPDDSRLLFHETGSLKTFELRTGYEKVLLTAYQFDSSDWGLLVTSPSHVPTADAGPDQVVECQGDLQAQVLLDASGSTDPGSTAGTNDDIVDFTWSEITGEIGTGETTSVSLGLGVHDITLTVVDSLGAEATDQTQITVEDSLVPTVEINFPEEEACFGPDAVPVALAASFADTCDPDPGVSYQPPNGVYDQHGDYLVTATATDAAGNSGSGTVRFTIDLQNPAVKFLQKPHHMEIPQAIPFNEVFQSSDDDTAAGSAVREVLSIDGCPLFDGSLYGDQDGLLSDEVLVLDVNLLCRAAEMCGQRQWQRPVLQIQVWDCGGNTARAFRRIPGSMKLPPNLCQKGPVADQPDPGISQEGKKVKKLNSPRRH